LLTEFSGFTGLEVDEDELCAEAEVVVEMDLLVLLALPVNTVLPEISSV
jgi:hypothetical protein